MYLAPLFGAGIGPNLQALVNAKGNDIKRISQDLGGSHCVLMAPTLSERLCMCVSVCECVRESFVSVPRLGQGAAFLPIVLFTLLLWVSMRTHCQEKHAILLDERAKVSDADGSQTQARIGEVLTEHKREALQKRLQSRPALKPKMRPSRVSIAAGTAGA